MHYGPGVYPNRLYSIHNMLLTPISHNHFTAWPMIIVVKTGFSWAWSSFITRQDQHFWPEWIYWFKL